jgi:hypothetical protein
MQRKRTTPRATESVAMVFEPGRFDVLLSFAANQKGEQADE